MTLACLIWNTEAERITRKLEQAGWPIVRKNGCVTLLSPEAGPARAFRSPWPAHMSAQVRRAAGYRCEFCHRSETELGYELEIDHVRSVNRGGTSTINNAQAVCRECHRTKQARMGLVFRM